MFIGLFILALAAFGSACSFGKAVAQNPQNAPKTTVKPTATATPYKPLKRVSRDIIKPETKEKAVEVKAKQ